MTTTFIETEACRRVPADRNQGEVAEIVNRTLCGAEDVSGMLRWLDSGQHLNVGALPRTHQLLYLMEGEGVISLEGKRYEVVKGAGVYLEPNERVRITHAGDGILKLLHLVVPIADH